MIIAIPSVTSYISDSRKNAYVDTAKEVIGSGRNLVNSGNLEMYDTDATYYLDVKCINTENAMKSPYGEFVDLGAYVVVTYNGKGYDYYWTSVDDAGQGIKGIVKYDKLDIDNIESDLKVDDISTLRTLDGRGKVILITDRNGCKKEGPLTQNLISVSSSTGEVIRNVVVYPTGKTKDTVVTGDIVTIDTEEFYVVKHDGSDLVLITKYILDVNDDPNVQTTGIQNSTLNGYLPSSGAVVFSSEDYWEGNVGEGKRYPGRICTETTDYENCAYVYDDNCNVKKYVDAYKDYLEDLGITVKEARLINKFEIYNLRNSEQSYVLFTGQDYWSGAPYLYHKVITVRDSSTVIGEHYSRDGVRPIIVI